MNDYPQQHATRRQTGILAALLVALVAVAAIISALAFSGGTAAGAGHFVGAAPASPHHTGATSSGPTRTVSPENPSGPSTRTAPLHHTPRSPGGGRGAGGTGPSADDGSGGSGGSGPGSGTRSHHHHRIPPHVTVRLSGPATYHGFCPVSLDYTATITVDRTPADISYHWVDGTASGVAHLHVTSSPVTVTRTLDPSSSTAGNIALEIVSPRTATSNPIHFDVECVDVTVGTATTNPPAYSGDCTRGIMFRTDVQVRVAGGPVTLHYRWVRSDGGVSAVQTATFAPGTSSQTLSNTWTLFQPAGTAHRWVQLQILDGPGWASNQSGFDHACV